MADCLIGLGSNIGDRAAQLDHAIARICGLPQTQLLGASRYRQTNPVGGPQGQDPFLNTAIRVTTASSPDQLLALLRQVEEGLGRRRAERWGPRILDIDLLLYDRLILDTETLVLPHPRMAVRRFVLEPACEIAADMIHAPTGWTLSRLLARLDEPVCYVAVTGANATARTEIVRAAAAGRQARLLCFALREQGETASFSSGTSQATLQRELDAVAEQAHMLSSIDASWASRPASLVLSNFWLNQGLAVARTWPASAGQSRLQQACLEALARAPQPKFVLFLDAPRRNGEGCDLGAPADPEAAGTKQRFSSWATDIPVSALREQIAQPGQCPFIRVAGADIDLAVIELTAAIDAMQ